MQPKGLPVGRDRPVTTSPGKEFGSRISPDGKWVLFIGTRGDARQVFVQQIDALQPQVVSLPPGLYDGCVWSPDQGQAGLPRTARRPAHASSGARLWRPRTPIDRRAGWRWRRSSSFGGFDTSIYLVSRVSRGQTGGCAGPSASESFNERSDRGAWRVDDDERAS
jgi:hypothetical protein